MKVLLVYKCHAEGAKDPYSSLLPIGLGYLNAYLGENGHHCRLANLSSYSWQEVRALFRAEQPQITGISQFTHNRADSLKLAEMAKQANPAGFVVFGGPHATHRFQEILTGNPAVDAVVLGEGEQTFLDLVASLSAESNPRLEQVQGIAFRRGETVVATAARPPIQNLDDLPAPASFFDNTLGIDPCRQLEFIVTSRGCPAACNFCSSPHFWGKTLRFRSPRAIVDEIKYIRHRYGLIYYSIRDDTFTADRQRVLEFCRLLIAEKVDILWNCQSRVNAVDEEMLAAMKKAGCECVQFGVESGSSAVLRQLGKKITQEQIRRAARAVREVGIQLSIYLITGVPGENEDDLRSTVGLIEAIRPHDGQVSPLVYYPGTGMFEESVRAGLVESEMFEKYPMASFPVRVDTFSKSSTRNLLRALGKAADRGRFTASDFRAQKKRLGYCHATNIIAGESYEEEGKLLLAENEYREIVSRAPENPWGWLAVGELLGRMGRLEEALKAFKKVTALVPAHVPAYSAMGDLYRLDGKWQNASTCYEKALQLNPFNEAARKGMKAMQRNRVKNS